MIALFWLCILFVVYVYIGYPIILYVLAKRHTLPLSEYAYTADISILMVVCNEELGIKKKIDNLLSLECVAKKNIIVVDDYSDDRTVEILKSYGDEITVVRSLKRLGKASGLNLGMKSVSTELVLMVDCRQRLEERVIVYLSSWFSPESKVGAVSGELMFELDEGNAFSEGIDGYWKYEKFIRKNESKLNSVPGVTGAIYMIRRKLFKSLPNDTLLDDVQIPMDCARQGYRVILDDRALAWDKPSTSAKKEEIRKVRTLSGNYQLLFRNPSWITPGGHPIWFQFFSHKIARLLAPFAGIASILLSLYLSDSVHPLYLAYFLTSLAVLVLLPLSIRYPDLIKVKIFKLLSSFLVMNWFCVVAAFRYFTTGSSGAWKR